MGLSSAMQWWEEWQLRILVLGSLFIQFLLFFSILRRASSLRRLRVLLWIAYIGGDAVPIYALATLFNRQKQTWDGESSTLEVLWVPVLLIHLGGQLSISAYSLEDNELWKRHTVTLLSQVTVALYIFCKWWSGEKRLLLVSILLFVVGILKFAQKPWALRRASFNTVSELCKSPRPMGQREETNFQERIFSLGEYVQEAKKCILHTTADRQFEDILNVNFSFFDMSAPSSFRIQELSRFLELEYDQAYKMLRMCLGCAFRNLYTRMGSLDTVLGVCLLFMLPFLALTSVVLFTTTYKHGHNKKDIMVTYILFSGTTMLESLLPCMSLCFRIPRLKKIYMNAYIGIGGQQLMVYQCNIISFCARKKKPTFLMRLVTFNFLRDFVNQHWYIEQVPETNQIMLLVRQHLEDGWNNYICDAASYRTFSELRGQWSVRRHYQLQQTFDQPFNDCVVIWHVATDLCFYDSNTSPQCRQGEVMQSVRQISNYMIYLLINRPEMLMPGTIPGLFTVATDVIVENSMRSRDMTEEILVQEILSMSNWTSPPNIVADARELARALMELDEENERWTVIQGVWVEMLCHSASRCRGYLHAKSLGEGGEYLSYIWLLWSFMGMETLADRHQI